jgi:hypothetical protein
MRTAPTTTTPTAIATATTTMADTVMASMPAVAGIGTDIVLAVPGHRPRTTGRVFHPYRRPAPASRPGQALAGDHQPVLPPVSRAPAGRPMADLRPGRIVLARAPGRAGAPAAPAAGRARAPAAGRAWAPAADRAWAPAAPLPREAHRHDGIPRVAPADHQRPHRRQAADPQQVDRR